MTPEEEALARAEREAAAPAALEASRYDDPDDLVLATPMTASEKAQIDRLAVDIARLALDMYGHMAVEYPSAALAEILRRARQARDLLRGSK
jgi:hypothetical protein